jgi:hypothetical protein
MAGTGAVQVDFNMVEAKPVEEGTANGPAAAVGGEGARCSAAPAEAEESILPVARPPAVEDVSLMQKRQRCLTFA